METTNLSDTTEYEIGAIVALSNHPYFDEKNNDTILIGGDSMSFSPLMVIIETNKETRSLHDEHTGFKITSKDSYQCKCLWFSHKTFQFHEAWLSSQLIKVIKQADRISSKLDFGTSVILKTATTEVCKKKVSLKQRGVSIDDNKSITGLVCFTSPVMQITGIVRNEFKPQFDQRTGQQKKQLPKQLVKCKYFNPNDDKFSEIILPFEALTVLSNHLDENLKENLKFLIQAISKKQKIRIASNVFEYQRTIIKPLIINYKLGQYYLDAKDLLTNKSIEVLISNSVDQFSDIIINNDTLPGFEVNGNRLSIFAIDKANVEALPIEKYWRIRYKDNTGNITIRTIYNAEFLVSEIVEDGVRKQVDYIKAKCVLRNHADRYFRIDRIQTLEVLDLNTPIHEIIDGNLVVPKSSDITN